MGCGVLEDSKLEHVPGTALYNEDTNAAALAAYEGIDIALLKRSPHNHDIILVPQPSSDPNDPLLWPTWKKHLFFGILVYGTVLVGAVGPLVAADQSHIAKIFGASLTSMARVLSSYFVLVLGIATIFFQVGSVKFGKRPIYLGTSLLLCACTVGASYCQTLSTFTACRVLMGISAAPLEFLVGASINDIYYVHERGLPVAIWNLALIKKMLGNPNVGFRWCFRYFAIACGVLCVLQFFFMPETTFIRGQIVHDHAAGGSSQTDDKPASQEIELKSEAPLVPLRGYSAGLRIFNGVYKTKASSLALLARPMLMLLTPIVFYSGLVYGMAITYLVLLAVSISVIFSFPPYNFSSASVGLTYLGPFIGAFLATLVAGPLTSWSARVLSKRNKGIYEPEFKLIPGMTLYLIFGVMGFAGYGWTLGAGAHWIAPVIFFSISNFAIVLGSTASISYLIDSNRHTTDAALGALIFWKNLWSFGLTWNIVEQIIVFGPRNVFAVVSGLIAVSCFLTIPAYIFGKRLRSFIHRHLPFSEEDEQSAVGH